MRRDMIHAVCRMHRFTRAGRVKTELSSFGCLATNPCRIFELSAGLNGFSFQKSDPQKRASI
ncbi:hypothetical protein DXA92_11245 [Agathobaculum butyriciproducens]|nr:hypothetical protein DXA94_02510 [Agathobaculum butyriciproducens]RGC59888.1 hypothetical protein DXA92_11245 [Agathobaculum butyriciproducens]